MPNRIADYADCAGNKGPRPQPGDYFAGRKVLTAVGRICNSHTLPRRPERPGKQSLGWTVHTTQPISSLRPQPRSYPHLAARSAVNSRTAETADCAGKRAPQPGDYFAGRKVLTTAGGIWNSHPPPRKPERPGKQPLAWTVHTTRPISSLRRLAPSLGAKQPTAYHQPDGPN